MGIEWENGIFSMKETKTRKLRSFHFPKCDCREWMSEWCNEQKNRKFKIFACQLVLSELKLCKMNRKKNQMLVFPLVRDDMDESKLKLK